MINSARLRSVVLISCAGLALTACSAAENATACTEIIGVLTDGSESIAAAVEDPATAGVELRAFAEELRSTAEGTDEAITSAAEDLATLYENMANDIETSGVPDVSQLSSTVLRLEEACT